VQAAVCDAHERSRPKACVGRQPAALVPPKTMATLLTRPEVQQLLAPAFQGAADTAPTPVQVARQPAFGCFFLLKRVAAPFVRRKSSSICTRSPSAPATLRLSALAHALCPYVGPHVREDQQQQSSTRYDRPWPCRCVARCEHTLSAATTTKSCARELPRLPAPSDRRRRAIVLSERTCAHNV